MSKRHSWKKNPNHFLSLDFFPEMTLTQFPKNIFFKNSWPYIQEKSLDFFSRNDAYSFPKKRFLEFWLDFFSKNDAYSFPDFWIFFPRFADRVTWGHFEVKYLLRSAALE